MRFLFSFVFCIQSLQASMALDKEIAALEDQLKKNQSEVEDLKLSVGSLDALNTRLDTELRKFEDSLEKQLEAVIVPLLSWPEQLFTTRARSWIELERAGIVLEQVREKLIQEPLQLIGDRELRISEVDGMKEELSAVMKELEMKQSMLNLRLEEMKIFKDTRVRKLRHASAGTKRVPSSESSERP